MTLKTPNRAQHRDVPPPRRGIMPPITQTITYHSVPYRQHPKPQTIPILQQPPTSLP